MSEVSGSLILKLTDQALNSLDDQSSHLSWENISSLLDAFNIELDLSDEKDLKQFNFSHEGLEKRENYALIYPFGEEFMHLMKLMVSAGENLEIYGFINHEYGVSEYYGLNAEGKQLVAHFDEEGEEEVDLTHDEIIADFISFVPDAIKQSFDDIF